MAMRMTVVDPAEFYNHNRGTWNLEMNARAFQCEATRKIKLSTLRQSRVALNNRLQTLPHT